MFTIDLKIPEAEFKKISKNAAAVRLGLLKGIKRAMLYAEGKAKKNFGGPNQLKVRSGHLRRSIRSGVTDKGREIVGHIGTNVVYAAIHEYGGIHPRSKDRSKRMPARPFIKPALTDHKNQVEIKRLIQKAIKAEVKKR